MPTSSGSSDFGGDSLVVGFARIPSAFYPDLKSEADTIRGSATGSDIARKIHDGERRCEQIRNSGESHYGLLVTQRGDRIHRSSAGSWIPAEDDADANRYAKGKKNRPQADDCIQVREPADQNRDRYAESNT